VQEIPFGKKFIYNTKIDGIFPESVFLTLFLKLHEIFMPRVFIPIHPVCCIRLPFLRVEPGTLSWLAVPVREIPMMK